MYATSDFAAPLRFTADAGGTATRRAVGILGEPSISATPGTVRCLSLAVGRIGGMVMDVQSSVDLIGAAEGAGRRGPKSGTEAAKERGVLSLGD